VSVTVRFTVAGKTEQLKVGAGVAAELVQELGPLQA
jgi:hypothetical protein